MGALMTMLLKKPDHTKDPARSRMVVSRLSEVQASDISFLIPPYLPMGKQTLLAGNPGDGKTWIALDLCARVTRGWDLLIGITVEGEPQAPSLVSEPGDALYLTGEDGAA